MGDWLETDREPSQSGYGPLQTVSRSLRKMVRFGRMNFGMGVGIGSARWTSC